MANRLFVALALGDVARHKDNRWAAPAASRMRLPTDKDAPLAAAAHEILGRLDLRC
jgi:hypothetical protein